MYGICVVSSSKIIDVNNKYKCLILFDVMYGMKRAAGQSGPQAKMAKRGAGRRAK